MGRSCCRLDAGQTDPKLGSSKGSEHAGVDHTGGVVVVEA